MTSRDAPYKPVGSSSGVVCDAPVPTDHFCTISTQKRNHRVETKENDINPRSYETEMSEASSHRAPRRNKLKRIFIETTNGRQAGPGRDQWPDVSR